MVDSFDLSGLAATTACQTVTFTPAFCNLRTSQTPDLRLKFELGQWLTPAPSSLIISTSAWER